MSSLGFAGLFLGFCALAAAFDMVELRIPNALTTSMALAGPVAMTLLGPGFGAVPAALATAALVLAAGWAMFELGWLGGGDAKLAAAAALWLGPQATLVFVLATALFGAVLAMAMLVLTRWSAARALIAGRWRARLGAETVSVPYAVAMAPGGAVAIATLLLA